MDAGVSGSASLDHGTRKWSMSTTTTAAQTPTDDGKVLQAPWNHVPMPPIPDCDADMASWRRRSLKRDSYTSQAMQQQPALAAAIRQNHRESVRASWIEGMRPESTYLPMATRAREVQQRSNAERGSTWTTDTANPQNWSTFRKGLQATAALLATLSITVSSAILISRGARDTHLSAIRLLHSAIFALGLAFVPITAPTGDVLGRKLAIGASLASMACFTLISAFVNHIAASIILRFLAGLAGSAILAEAPAMLLDVHAAGQRTVSITLYATAIAGGTTLGPILGTIAIQNRPLTWCYYVVLIILAAASSSLCFTRESHKDTILRRRLDVRRSMSSIRYWRAVLRPFRLLITQLEVWLAASCISIYAFTGFGLLQGIPLIFETVYSFELAAQGCVVLSIACGYVLAIVCFVIHHIFFYIPRRAEWEDAMATEMEKAVAARARIRSRHSVGPAKLKRNSAYRTSMPVKSTSMISLRPLAIAQESDEVLPGSSVNLSAGLAVAIAQELNNTPGNENRSITPERVWMVASAMPTFEQLLDELELKFDFVVHRDRLAAIHEAWTDRRASAVLTGHNTPRPETPQAAQLAEKTADAHRAATLAALEQIPSSSQTDVSSTITKKRQSQLMPLAILSKTRPPPHWRMALALPGAMLATAGLFVLAWTSSTHLHWMVPIVGLACFGCGGFLAAICVCLYLTDRFGASDTITALVVTSSISYLLAFAATMITRPIYETAGIGWATSVYAFCSIIAWLGPASLAYGGLSRQQDRPLR